jgi:hypothetical protein
VAQINNSRQWLVLLAGVYLLFTAIRGLATGRMILIYRSVNRSNHEVLYWLSIVISIFLGVASILIIVLKL